MTSLKTVSFLFGIISILFDCQTKFFISLLSVHVWFRGKLLMNFRFVFRSMFKIYHSIKLSCSSIINWHLQADRQRNMYKVNQLLIPAFRSVYVGYNIIDFSPNLKEQCIGGTSLMVKPAEWIQNRIAVKYAFAWEIGLVNDFLNASLYTLLMIQNLSTS